MSFLSLILKNPFRNKARASLAIVGISIGLATIILLGAITAGMEDNVNGLLTAGGADFSVSGKSSESGSFFGTEDIDERWLPTISNIDGVKEVAGGYISPVLLIYEFSAPLIGIDSKNVKFIDLTINEGRIYQDSKDEIVLGKLAAKYLNKSVNDSIILKDKKFKIVGIFETGNLNIDWCGLAGMDNVQTLAGSSQNNNITIIYAKIEKDANVEEITKKIEDKYKENITAITSLDDIESIANTMNMISSATWGISILAIIIGAIGIINTMITAIYERTREIGVLKAIGWSNQRILAMILGESLVLTISAGIIGALLGIIAAELANYTYIIYPATTSLILLPFVHAFIVAIIVGLIGGFYPAWRAIKLQPTEALGYE